MNIEEINIDGYVFEGSYDLNTANFNDVPGVYLISDTKGSLIDVGETDELRTRLSSHERKSCWRNNAVGSVSVWFHYQSSQNLRLQTEKTIRNNHNFSCGTF